MKKSEKNKQEFQSCKFLIDKFLKSDTKINWPREVGICKKLLNKYPDLEFWKFVNLDFELNCCAYLLSPTGIQLLEDKFAEYKQSQKIQALDFSAEPSYDVQQEKVGEDSAISSSKKKPLIKFLTS